MTSPVLETTALGMPWATVDPFLFCVHHLDRYPAGNGSAGPSVALTGRALGNDFEPRDGWRMYHGLRTPGFPQHPHRGFETVTFVRRGYVDHADSLGSTARYGRGDVQWMTAGRGIVHAEMFPLLDAEEANTLELFQIWLNLPSAAKMVEPSYSMLWDEDIPRVVEVRDGRVAEVTVVAGALAGVTPPAPPPDSWARKDDAELAIWHVRLEPGAGFSLPAAHGDDTRRVLYVFDGASATLDGVAVGGGNGALVEASRTVELESEGGAEVLVLQGRPIGEPVAQYGPFVMNNKAEIEQAFRDYQRTQFGGWPWPSDEPVHGLVAERFARRTDGRVERPEGAAAV